MQVHIKTDEDWTFKLRSTAKVDKPEKIHVGIDSPFGAPAQRFYDFGQTIILGSGIGVTPFSEIVTDLQARESVNVPSSIDRSVSNEKLTTPSKRTYRRVDFHWIVKDKNYVLWFSNLLNEISKSSSAHYNDTNPHLDAHISTHVIQKSKNLSTHVFRYLLEIYRTQEHLRHLLQGS
jgi:dual oxidase